MEIDKGNGQSVQAEKPTSSAAASGSKGHGLLPWVCAHRRCDLVDMVNIVVGRWEIECDPMEESPG